ncbi:MAG: TolC family protein [Nitritalea sp.]
MQLLRTSQFLLMALLLLGLASCKIQEISPLQPNLDRLGLEQPRPEVLGLEKKSLEPGDFFADTLLLRLIEVALGQNQQLARAALERDMLGLQFRQQKRNNRPLLSAQAGAGLTRFGRFTMDGVGNKDTNLSDALPPAFQIPDPVYRDFQVLPTFSWEIDLWGKYRNLRKRAEADFLRQSYTQQFLRNQLTSTVAMLYYSVAAQNEKVSLLRQTIGKQEEALKYVRQLKDAGQHNELAVKQFEAIVFNVKTRLIEEERVRQDLLLALNQVLGSTRLSYTPATFKGDFSLENLPLSYSESLQALYQRPDVLAAEQELQLEQHQLAVLRAAFYPTLQLRGFLGLQSFDPARLFQLPAGLAAQAIGMLHLPIFQQGQLKAQFEIGKLKRQQALLAYEDRLLQAHTELLQTWNSFFAYQGALQAKGQEVEVLRQATHYSRELFAVGYASYVEVILANLSALDAEIEAIELKKIRNHQYVSLFRATGT